MKRRRLLRRLWLAGWLCLTLHLLRAADYVGYQACAECHRARAAMQAASHHAHSLRPIEGSLVGMTLLRDGHSPDHRLRYEASGDTIVVHEDGVPESTVLEWAFGAGAQGSTPVGHLGEQFVEHRFSYYARIQDLAPTFGHPPHVSTRFAELGLLQDKRTIFHCFNCHATGVRQGPSGPELTGMFPGVQCERCHGPGSSHIRAAKDGASPEAVRREVVNPGRLPVKVQIEMCGECHRLPTPDMGDKPELENPVNVRFAPIGLLASRCFRATGTLSCLTCHDPHEDARPLSDFSYSEKCLVCHGGDHKPVRLCRRTERQNCLPCHMKQASLGLYLRFTDHRIRVY